MAAIIGVEALLRIDLDSSPGPLFYVSEALDGVQQKLDLWRSKAIPGFGRPIGFIINFSPDHAVQFTLDGTLLHVLERAYRPGSVEFQV